MSKPNLPKHGQNVFAFVRYDDVGAIPVAGYLAEHESEGTILMIHGARTAVTADMIIKWFYCSDENIKWNKVEVK